MPDEICRTGVVTKPYRQPYPDPIRVSAGERVSPDFAKSTDVPGWVWCTDDRGRSGWTPLDWLAQDGGARHMTRDFDAIELCVDVGARVVIHAQIASFYWVTTDDRRTGWVPCSHICVDD
ncbi:MAG: SH3 domain-containing protein [Gammaproteobacteria bacterium]